MSDETSQKSDKRRLTALLGGASALALFGAVMTGFEGDKSVAYRDEVGVVTACKGITGHGIVLGRRYSDEQCDAWFYQEAVSKLQAVAECTPAIRGRGKLMTAAGSLAYNIGTRGYCRSSIPRLFAAGRWRAACDAFRKFRFAGGRVSRGLILRRERERLICLDGVREAGR